jgi:hypothetical protein
LIRYFDISLFVFRNRYPVTGNELFQQRDHPLIEFDGGDVRGACQQFPREDADARADLHDVFAGFYLRCFDNRAQNLRIRQKVLPEVGVESQAMPAAECAHILCEGGHVAQSVARMCPDLKYTCHASEVYASYTCSLIPSFTPATMQQSHSSLWVPATAALIACALLLVQAWSSISALAQTQGSAVGVDFFQVDVSRYGDGPWDRPTNVAVSMLTRLQIVQGHPDGTFRIHAPLNRAEFMQIALRILPANAGSDASLHCFPDVRSDVWYADPVCRAKHLGIVRGNVRSGVPAAQWRFEPARPVQYEEAAKILLEILDAPVTEGTGEEWYVPYLQFLRDHQLLLAPLRPGDTISRGQMARLTAAALAWDVHRLDEYRLAEQQEHPSSPPSVSSPPSSPPSSPASVSSPPSSPPSSPAPTAPEARPNILLLGRVSSPLAGVQFFSTLEPVNATAITVTLTEDVPSVTSILVYNEFGTLLGTAARIGPGSYRLSLATGAFPIPLREERRLYVEARIAAADAGGRSGDAVQVATIRLQGTGSWSNEPYDIASTDTFPRFQTALSRVTAVRNAGTAEAVLVGGADQVIAAFHFEGEQTDPTADLQLSTLVFDVVASEHFTLSSPTLGTPDSAERLPCTLADRRITCSAIPASIGRIRPNRTVRLHALVTVAPLPGTRTLRVSLHRPGFPGDPGDITWTDGVTVFTWLPLDQPVAEGTVWR